MSRPFNDGVAGAIYYNQLDFYMHQLMPTGQDTLRLLVSRMNIPYDAPSVFDVVCGTLMCINAFSDSLNEPSGELVNLSMQLENLQKGMEKLDRSPMREVSNPFFRRLNKYHQWRLLMMVGKDNASHPLLKMMGAELASALLAEKKLRAGFASELYKVIFDRMQISAKFSRTIATLEVNAAISFEMQPSRNESSSCASFEQKVINFYKGKIANGGEKAHQASLDSTCLTHAIFIEVAKELCKRLHAHESDAVLTMLAAHLGFPFNLVLDVPILSAIMADGWVLCLDLDKGCIQFDLSIIAEGAVQAYNSRLYHPSSTILVKPIPRLLFDELSRLRSDAPNANAVGELLGKISINSRSSINSLDTKISISYARFLNSFGRVAILEGVDPLLSALISNDFRLVPKSKIYYRLTFREQMWAASSKYFNRLGWGEPVAMVQGLPTGSCVILRNEVLAEIFNTMHMRVQECRPPTKATLSALITFHNSYAHYSASLTVLNLALRERKPLTLLSSHYRPHVSYIMVNDKAVKGEASNQPVAISSTLQQQLDWWILHCNHLSVRLKKLGLTATHPFVIHLDRIVNHDAVPLFVQCIRGKLDLVN